MEIEQTNSELAFIPGEGRRVAISKELVRLYERRNDIQANLQCE